MNRVLPILFNTEMVRAILDGRKGATRRSVKGYIPDDAVWGYTAFTPKGYISCIGTFADGYGEKFFKLPCEPGDILYVRETWKKAPNGYYYYEDWQRNDIADVTKWKPSIHMPKEAARIWIKVTNVRVERLQEITIDGIRNEGISSMAVHAGDMEIALKEWKNLWNSTIKKTDLDSYVWEANPYVFVIEFIRIDKPEEI